MYKPNPGEIEYNAQGIKENLRVDGRRNTEQRQLIIKKGVLQQANGSSFVKVFDSSSSLYIGIKAEIIDLKSDSQEGEIKFKIDSMKRRDAHLSQQQQKDNQFSDSYLLKYLEQQINNKLTQFINKSQLVLVKGKKAIQLNIDAFLIDLTHFCYIDLISYGIRKAIEDLKIPEMNITHNYLTNEEEIDLLEDKMKSWSLNQDLQIPYLFTVGELDNQLVFDLTLDEYYSVSSRYLVSAKNDGTICAIEKTGTGFMSPENIFRITNFIQKQVKVLVEQENIESQIQEQQQQQNNQQQQQNIETE